MSGVPSRAQARRLERKLLPVLLSFALLATAACGSRNDDDDSAAAPAAEETDSPSVDSSATEAPAPATEESAPADSTAAPGPDAAVVTPAPATSPSPAPAAPKAAAAKPSGAKAPAPAAASGSDAAKPAAPAPAQSGSKSPSPASPAPAPPAGGGASPAPGAAPAPAPSGPKSEILLGSFGQASGPIGALTVPTIVAAKAWAADVNARGGLNGHPVRIIFADDGGDPNRALSIVRNFVEKDKILAVFAEHGPVTVAAVMPYLEKVGVPRVGSVEGNAVVDTSPVSFHVTTGADKGTSWSHLLPLKELAPDVKKIYTIYCREVANCKNFNDHIVGDGYAKQLGFEVVGSSQASLAQPDFTPEVLSARNAGADAIVVIMENASTVRVARAVKRQGGGMVIGTQQSMDTDSFYKNGGADVEGIVGGSSTAAYLSSAKMKDYRDAVAKYVPGGERGAFGAAAWASGKLLEAVAPKIDADPTSAELLEALYGLRNETLGGIVPPLTFPKGRSHENVNHCLVVGKVVNGKFAPKDGDPDKFVCAPGWKPETP